MIPAVFGQLTLAVYGLLLALGGYIGYKRAGSRASLRAGLVTGFLAFLAAGFATANPEIANYSLRFGAVLAGLMALMFGFRYKRSGKFMPSGLLMVASAVVLLVLLGTFIRF